MYHLICLKSEIHIIEKNISERFLKKSKKISFEMYHLICLKSEIHTIEKNISERFLKKSKKGKFRNVPSKIGNPHNRKEYIRTFP